MIPTQSPDGQVTLWKSTHFTFELNSFQKSYEQPELFKTWWICSVECTKPSLADNIWERMSFFVGAKPKYENSWLGFSSTTTCENYVAFQKKLWIKNHKKMFVLYFASGTLLLLLLFSTALWYQGWGSD